MAAPLSAPTAPPPAPDVVTASAAYARRFSGPVGEWLLARQTEALRELLAPWPDAAVLDVGGGHAQVAAPLVAEGRQITVTGSAEVCRERLDRLLPAGSFTFRRCPLLPLPFADASFDVAVAVRLLTHVPPWRELLGELSRVARTAVVVDFPERRGIHRLARPLFGWKLAVEKDTRPYHSFAAGEVGAELVRQGWRELCERRELFLPLGFHRLLGRPSSSRALEGAAARLGLTRRWGGPVMLRGSGRR